MWTRNIDDVLLSLWFNGPEFPDKLMKPAKTKTQMMSNPVSKEETSSLPPPLPPAPSFKMQGSLKKCTWWGGVRHFFRGNFFSRLQELEEK